MPGSSTARPVGVAAAAALLAAAVLPAAFLVPRPVALRLLRSPLLSAAGRLVPPAVYSGQTPGRPTPVPAPEPRRIAPTARRITLVLLGDGFTADQMGLFRREADRAWRSLMAIEPFRTYQHFFTLKRIEVASPVAGIREQPSPWGAPASPLRMHFWCHGTARLLCVDEHAAVRLAGRVPGPHFLIAIANSGRYGGAGGSGVTTLAGGSPDAGRILQHEMGHTVGNLGDEYDSAPPDDRYPNLSREDAAEMAVDRTKWWRWLGAPSPDGSPVGAYPSGNGLYRPTAGSVMRTLGGEYNPPCREAIILALYRRIGPLDGASPAPGAVSGRPRLTVRPIPLAGHRWMQIAWRLNGRPLRAQGRDGTWLDSARLRLPRGRTARVTATVRDTTPWVRDEAFRDRRMTRTVSWTLRG